MKRLSWTLKEFIIWVIFGGTYCLLEIIYRGYTHPSMFVVGGLCGVLIGLINDHTPQMPLLKQSILGSVIVTVIEFIAGVILNLWLGLDVWNYSSMPFNLLGQICLPFSLIWLVLSVPVVYLDDYLKKLLK